MKSPDHQHHVVGRTGWTEASLLLREDPVVLAVVAQALGDGFKLYFATARYKGDAAVVATLRRVLLLEQHLNDGVLPQLRHLSRPLHDGDDIMESREEVLVSIEE